MRWQVQAAGAGHGRHGGRVSPAVRLGEPRPGWAGPGRSGPPRELIGASCRGGCPHLGAPFPNAAVPLACAGPT